MLTQVPVLSMVQRSIIKMLLERGNHQHMLYTDNALSKAGKQGLHDMCLAGYLTIKVSPFSDRVLVSVTDLGIYLYNRSS